MHDTKTLLLFPTAVTRVVVKRHDTLNRRLMSEIENIRAQTSSGMPRSWASVLYTTLGTDNTLHLRGPFEEFTKIMSDEVRVFAETKSVDLHDNDIFIQSCWLNVFHKGHSMDVHNHPNSVFTGIYFVKAPAGGARLLLRSPTKEMGLTIPVTEENELNRNLVAYKPNEGDLILFDSHVLYNFHLHDVEDEHINLTFTAAARSL